MQKWMLSVSLSIFLLTGLSTSSFFLPDFLTLVIKNDAYTTAQLNFAVVQENKAALLYLFKQTKEGDKEWQKLAKKLAESDGEIAYELAGFYLKQTPFTKNALDKKRIETETPSSTEIINIKQAKLWYQQAIRLNNANASIALAELNFQQGNMRETQNLLHKFQVTALSANQPNNDALGAIILITKIAINKGDIELAYALIDKYETLLQADELGALLLSSIEKYQILRFTDQVNIQGGSDYFTCGNSIQLFATNLLHLAQAEQLVKGFKHKPLNNLVCFSPVRYLPLSSMSCLLEKKEAIQCDESKFDEVADSVTARFIGIMLPEGGANVHLGILYFDAQDSIDVVEHEVSHLLGFVDEYPLVKGHVKCQKSQKQIFAQNISILQTSYQGDRALIREKILKQLAWAKQIKKNTPILHTKEGTSQKDKFWQLGTPKEFDQEIGLYRSDTCAKNSAERQSSFTAFKPLSSRTKLQYDQLNFPPEYLAFLDKNSDHLLMPSFHYNIALAYYRKNKLGQANDWLEQAASWEKNDRRRERIRRGSF
jgi:hypothetical protein